MSHSCISGLKFKYSFPLWMKHAREFTKYWVSFLYKTFPCSIYTGEEDTSTYYADYMIYYYYAVIQMVHSSSLLKTKKIPE